MTDIVVHDTNNVFIQLECSPSIENELWSHFTFFAPNFKHHPKYKARIWDGKIRLFNRQHNSIYRGLLNKVIEFAQDRGYSIDLPCDALKPIDRSELETRVRERLPSKFDLRPYQIDAIEHCLNSQRATIISPTASGKSLIIYQLIREIDLPRTLIIVPTKNLVQQMKSDFIDYGASEQDIQLIYADQEKAVSCPIVVSTWQSAIKMDDEWLEQFDVVIGDEAHTCKSKSLINVLSRCNARYRFGFTGTLNDIVLEQMVIEGLFGPKCQFVTTKELIDDNWLSKPKIHAIICQYPEEARKNFAAAKRAKQMSYTDEIDLILANRKRNNLIINILKKQQGVNLVLFDRIEKHGDILYEMARQELSDVDNFFVSGKISNDERERIRQAAIASKRCNIFASLKTFAMGVNIPGIQTIIDAHPKKAKITLLQSVGRGLRRTEDKNKLLYIDLVDDLSWKKTHNTTLKHYLARVKIYNEEKFDFIQTKVKF